MALDKKRITAGDMWRMVILFSPQVAQRAFPIVIEEFGRTK
jgi:hypothetical protein